MTREEILQTFSDINYAYNNSSKYDTLKRMLDELVEQKTDIIMIRINAVISKEYEKEFRENIIRQKETGVIILPYFAEPIIIPKDIEIKINEESEV